MKLAVAFLALVAAASATTGFDAIGDISVATFKCLKNAGYQFYIARVWESIGNYDLSGFQNVKNARAAGIEYVDGYIFPCLSSRCASPANQVHATVDRIRSTGTKVGMLWLDIERLNWSTNQAHNQQIIIEMGNELNALKVNWGIYTNYYMWEEIVGLGWSHFSNKPLWWANYNGQPGFAKFIPFGGWSHATIHQYAGDVKPACGLDLDLNYY